MKTRVQIEARVTEAGDGYSTDTEINTLCEIITGLLDERDARVEWKPRPEAEVRDLSAARTWRRSMPR